MRSANCLVGNRTMIYVFHHQRPSALRKRMGKRKRFRGMWLSLFALRASCESYRLTSTKKRPKKSKANQSTLRINQSLVHSPSFEEKRQCLLQFGLAAASKLAFQETSVKIKAIFKKRFSEDWSTGQSVLARLIKLFIVNRPSTVDFKVSLEKYGYYIQPIYTYVAKFQQVSFLFSQKTRSISSQIDF